jgi:hypothetical protein
VTPCRLDCADALCVILLVAWACSPPNRAVAVSLFDVVDCACAVSEPKELVAVALCVIRLKACATAEPSSADAAAGFVICAVAEAVDAPNDDVADATVRKFVPSNTPIPSSALESRLNAGEIPSSPKPESSSSLLFSVKRCTLICYLNLRELEKQKVALTRL